MKNIKSRLEKYVGIFANTAECYAGGLLMFSMPFLSRDVYLPGDTGSQVMSNFLLYGLSLWSYPLGSLMFGWLGDRYGRRPALIMSVGVMLLALCAMVLCPRQTVDSRLIAFLALSLYHMGSGAEMSGGALFSLEHGSKNHQGRISGYICTFSVLGILMASGALSLLQSFEQTFWWAFYVAIALMILVLVSVFFAQEPLTFAKDRSHEGWRVGLRPFITCFMVASVFGVSYYVPFVFLPQMATHLTSLPLETTAHLSTLSLGLYMLSLFATGFMADGMGIRPLMRYASLALLVASPLAFWLAWQGSLLSYGIAQGILAMAAGFFISPSHALMASLFPPHSRYRLMSVTFAVAFTFVGGPTSAILWWIYDQTGQIFLISLWGSFWLLGAYVSLTPTTRQQKFESMQTT